VVPRSEGLRRSPLCLRRFLAAHLYFQPINVALEEIEAVRIEIDAAKAVSPVLDTKEAGLAMFVPSYTIVI
jgi:hypothetical protein